MSVVCFVSYEFHPITQGGCGVLVHHATERLLHAGHTVVLLLDLPRPAFDHFVDVERMRLPAPERCRAYHVTTLCPADEAGTLGSVMLSRSVRFARALAAVLARERIDLVEFFDYCGPAYYTLVEHLFAPAAAAPTLGVRLHGAFHLIDRVATVADLGRERVLLHRLEESALRLAEVILAPSRGYVDGSYGDSSIVAPEKVVVSEPPTAPLPAVARVRDEDRVAIVGFARLVPCKGLDQLIDAASILLCRHPTLPLHVEVIGDDSLEGPQGTSYAGFLRSRIPAALEDRFTFHGHLSHEAAARVLARAAFAVFPNRSESFCYALHETYALGVPIVATRLPAFVDFLRDEVNALLYDGTAAGLVAAMERLAGDAALRARLAHPHAIADAPLGPYYDAPRPLAPVRTSTGATLHPLVIVTEPRDTTATERDRTLACMRNADADVLVLEEAEPSAGNDLLWWLGMPWRVRDTHGHPRSPIDLVTRDALVVFRAGDVPEPEWLALCGAALARRPSLAFAGSWMRLDGRVVPSIVDLAPETYPFEHGAARMRVLLRTTPGTLLIDLFDPELGTLGEVGYVWRLLGTHDPGCLVPRPLVDVAADVVRAPNPSQLQLLVHGHGRHLGPQLALFLANRTDTSTSVCWPEGRPWMAHLPPTVPSYRWAANQLDGRTLVRLAMGKLRRKLGLDARQDS